MVGRRADRRRTQGTLTGTGVSRRSAVVRCLTAIIVVALALTNAGFAGSVTAHPTNSVVADDDWLGVVNAYRAMSNLGPVVENPTWSAEGEQHSRYMLVNGITHVQNPGNPGYTEGGDRAGRNGNVATSSNPNATARRFVELWMTGPFHAIGVLRHDLTTTGFGLARDPNADRWRSGATLDVLRGLNRQLPRRTTATVFPGNGATVSVDRFVAEYPDPVTLVGWTGPAGLPLIAMMPNPVSTAQATLTGPTGPVEVRSLHPGNPGTGPGADLARQVMASENAVVIVPRNILTPGRYTATVTTDGGSITWTFTIDPTAPLTLNPAATPNTTPATAPTAPTPDTRILADPSGFVPVQPFRHVDSRRSLHTTRLAAGTTRTIRIGNPTDVAASINVTVVDPAGPGFLSVLGANDTTPQVSTVNFDHQPAANHVIATIRNGTIGLHASVDAHVIIDINGFFRPNTGDTLVPITPTRVLDTRAPHIARLTPNTTRTIQVTGTPAGAPTHATAVALNLTMVNPTGNGYLSVWPTGTNATDVSNLNVTPNETRPNSTIVPVSPNGTITISASTTTDLLIDVTGYLTNHTGQGAHFTPVTAIRLLDTRMTGPINPATNATPLQAGNTVRIPIAGVRGIPTDTTAVWVNITAVNPTRHGFITAYPGGPLPTTSTINTTPGNHAIANGALIALHNGAIHIYTDHDVHILVDLTGIWR